MKSLFTMALCALLLSSCSTNREDVIVPQDEIAQKPVVTGNKGIYPDTIKLFDIIGRLPASTWQEIDYYYRVEIPMYHNNRDYTQNLQKKTLFHMFENFDAANNASTAALEKYAQDQLGFDMPDTDVLIKNLNALKGYWTDEKIKAAAQEKYVQLINYIKTKMKNPDALLVQMKAKYDRFKAFGDNFGASK